MANRPVRPGKRWRARERAARWLGLPVTVGIGATKTLAKVATNHPKDHRLGVFNFDDLGPAEQAELLATVPVGEVWGIGGRVSARLIAQDVATARALADLDPGQVLRMFNVVVEQNGIHCSFGVGERDRSRLRISLAGSRVWTAAEDNVGIDGKRVVTGRQIVTRREPANPHLVHIRATCCRNGGRMTHSIRTSDGAVGPAPCSLCAVVSGRAPAIVVREWPDAVAVRPRSGGVAEGHVLVIPRVHVQDAGVDPVVTAAVMARAAELMAALPNANLVSSKGIAASQTQRHLHVHVVPREFGDGLPLPWTPQQASRADQETCCE